MVVVADIDRDPVEPRFRIAADARPIPEQPQEDFLGGILRIFHAAQQPVSGPHNLLPVRGHLPVVIKRAIVRAPVA